MTALQIQQQARENWRAGKFDIAADLYRKSAEKLRGFARKVNLSCAADCDARKTFNGTPRED